MLSGEIQVRVRYAETDKMGYVYYGNYAQYYEIGRTEFMRKRGITYRELEDSGIMLPVLSLNSKFIRPARYDDLLTIKTTLTEIPQTRITFQYEIYNQNGELVNKGDTMLVFVNVHTHRPIKAPQELLNKLADDVYKKSIIV